MRSKVHRPRMVRFFGFKTNAGFDEYPRPRFGFHNLFNAGEDSYSSEAVDGPALVQGVYIPEDVGQMYEDDVLLRQLVDGKMKMM